MKKTLLAIALAVATMPLTFAAQGNKAVVPAHNTATVAGKPATRNIRKHHVRKHLKKTNRTAVRRARKTTTTGAALARK